MGYFRDNIEKMEGYKPGFQPKEADVVKLNTNENPYPPSPKVMQAIASMQAEKLRRYPDPTADTFRRAAGEVLGVKMDNIMCTNGGDELLSMAIRAFCDENRPVAYPIPTYSLYPVLAKLQNCKAIEIPFDGEFNLPSGLVKSGAALTIICNPNAPTGSFISVGELASFADEIKGILLVDEAYVDFADETCAGLIKDFDNVIILRSLSKGYSLAGLRLGYALADEKLISGLMKLKDSYNVDSVSIAAATAAIRDQEHFKKNIEKIKTERTFLTENLCEIGFTVPKSYANFVLAKSEKMDANSIYEKLIKRKIYVRYWNLPMLEDKLRITVGTRERNEKLISALREILSG